MNMQTRQHCPGAKSVNEKLKAAQADRDVSDKTIYKFIQEAKPYTQAQTAVYYQRHRVKWVIKEARLMEIEMFHQSKKNNTKVDTNVSKKRQRDDHEEIPLESQSKRIKQKENGFSSAFPGGPQIRRSTRHIRQ